MTERIKELALQALKHPDNDNDGLTVFDTDELEKFAELIINDCLDIVDVEVPGWVGLHAMKKISEHFGVEE